MKHIFLIVLLFVPFTTLESKPGCNNPGISSIDILKVADDSIQEGQQEPFFNEVEEPIELADIKAKYKQWKSRQLNSERTGIAILSLDIYLNCRNQEIRINPSQYYLPSMDEMLQSPCMAAIKDCIDNLTEETIPNHELTNFEPVELRDIKNKYLTWKEHQLSFGQLGTAKLMITIDFNCESQEIIIKTKQTYFRSPAETNFNLCQIL